MPLPVNLISLSYNYENPLERLSVVSCSAVFHNRDNFSYLRNLRLPLALCPEEPASTVLRVNCCLNYF